MVSPTRKPHGTFDHHSLVWLINFESLRPVLCFQPQPSLDHKLRFAAGLFSSACVAAIHHLQEGLVGDGVPLMHGLSPCRAQRQQISPAERHSACGPSSLNAPSSLVLQL